MVRVCSLIAVAALVAACGSSLSSVPVKGETEDVARIAGEWKGEFEGLDNNERRGTIDFILQMGRHTADAKVTMVGAMADGKQLRLGVEYLQISDGAITGKVQPYRDETCKCTVETEFEGVLSGDFIVGTYLARMSGQELRGQWSAERIHD